MLKGTALLRKQARLCSGQQVAALGSTTKGRRQGSYQLPTKKYAVGQAAITQKGVAALSSTTGRKSSKKSKRYWLTQMQKC
jgi:hypothetical protein